MEILQLPLLEEIVLQEQGVAAILEAFHYQVNNKKTLIAQEDQLER